MPCNDIEEETLRNIINSEVFLDKDFEKKVLSFIRYLKETFYIDGRLREDDEPLDFFVASPYFEPSEMCEGRIYGHSGFKVEFVIGGVGLEIDFTDDDEINITMQDVVGYQNILGKWETCRWSPGPEPIAKILNYFAGKYGANIRISPYPRNLSKEYGHQCLEVGNEGTNSQI